MNKEQWCEMWRLSGDECDIAWDKKQEMHNNPQTSTYFKLDGTNPDFPGAYEKWANDREKRARKHKRQ